MKMKNVFAKMMTLLVASAVMLCSCGKDDDPVKEPEGPDVPGNETTDVLPVIADANWVFSSEAGVYALEVPATVNWKAVSNAGWLKIDKTSGTNDVNLQVTLEENTTGAERKAAVTITNTADNKVIFTFGVTQAAVSYVINVTGEDAEIPATGGFIIMEVEANKDYALEMEEWVAEVPAETNAVYGAAKSSLKFYVGANPLTVARTSKVTVKDGGEVKKTITLRQLASEAPVVEVLPDTLFVNLDEAVNGVLQIPEDGGVITAVSHANRDYDVYLTFWMKKQPVTNSVYTGDPHATTLYLAVDPNMTSVTRQASLVFECPDTTMEFKVVQDPVTIQVELEGVKALPATANISTPVRITMPKKIKLSSIAMTEILPEGEFKQDATVKDKNVYTFSIHSLYANTTTSVQSRLMGLRLETAEGFRYDWNVQIDQFGLPYFIVDESAKPVFFPAQGVESFELKVTMTVNGGELPEGLDYVIEVGENTWIHAEKSLVDPTVVTVSLDNNELYEPREGEITFRFNNEAYTQSRGVAISQKAKEKDYELVVNNQKILDYSATSVEIMIEKSLLPVPDNEDVTYYVKMEVVGTPVYFTSTSGMDVANKRAVEFFIQPNTMTEERVETLVAKIIKRTISTSAEEVIYTTPEFKITQPGKPAVQKVTATVKGRNTILNPKGQGAPVQLEVSGAETYQVVLVYSGRAFSQYIEYDTTPDEYGVINLWQKTAGPPPSLIYVLPAGETWSAENVENYGKIEGLSWQ